MPSVLIETGFLPNPTEEKFIGGAEGQEKMAQSMFSAFEAYKNQMEGKVVPEIIDSPDPTVVVEVVSENKLEIDTNQNKLVFSIQIATSSQKYP